ncbi:glycosyltransferase family 2 protein [Novosphingobium album (ex Hu et al. 2023)]|uniref:Glycosyltransferase family 2 protein n=1 Tax=Novosphingobium album (ex Hu et al. 2023) TaxID=2930093 RepID=A0ABT0B0N2_9SPHN|nr:glycosyltransferase family 2 protein [Novosphingobium album (ex Hu et al. 2023)]MCJ2178607.1 glycosyltransferase family 2 protein [Novosphingobium album (ex Hu et al. 2023)]
MIQTGLFQDVAPKSSSDIDIDISVVIPFLNEAETLEQLHTEITSVLSSLKKTYEIILVNDGSTDIGSDVAESIAEKDSKVVLISFRRNFGKAAALSAGFQIASGKIVITMDADLQDNPKEIPHFLEAIENGADLVSGWKQVRNDPLDKTLPSKVFNLITSRTLGISIHDINCGFKAYRHETLQHLHLYGELHRFTPALLSASGFEVTEIKVEHRPRAFGKSKYGWNRFIKGLLDLMTVLLQTRYGARPLHFFALIGLPLFILGFCSVMYLISLWFLGMGPIGNRPLLQIGILLIVTGVQFLGTGLIAELVRGARITEKDKYAVKVVHRSKE